MISAKAAKSKGKLPIARKPKSRVPQHFQVQIKEVLPALAQAQTTPITKAHETERNRARPKGMISLAMAFILSQGRVQADRQVLCRLPGPLIGPLLCSPTGQKAIATVHLFSGDWVVCEDGRIIGRYNGNDPILHIPESHRPGLDVKFSKDGRHYAFVGVRDGRQIPVIDGIEQQSADRIEDFVWSPTGNSYAYVKIDSKKSQLIRDGRKTAPNGDYIGRLLFSPDGRRAAWIAESPGFALFLDGKQLTPRQGDDPKAFQQVHQFRFSPDSRHFAYIQGVDPDVRIVQDEEVVANFKEVSGGIVQDIEFSPGRQRLAVAYGGIWTTQVGFIENGKLVPAGPASGTRQGDQFIWSPNGEHYAAAVWRANKTYAVLDGVEMPPHVFAFSRPGWVLDDGRFAYCSSDLTDGQGVLWTTHFGDREFSGWLLEDITPDGLHLAMCRSTKNLNTTPVQVDGRTYGPEGEPVRELAFSRPSAKHFYFRTSPENVDKLYIDGVLQPFDGDVIFSPDESHFAIAGQNRASVDGETVFPRGCSQPHLFWDNATTFHGYAIVNNQIVKTTGKINP